MNELSKTEVTELLQETIQQLANIVEKLESDEIKNLPEKADFESLRSDTQALASVFQALEKQTAEAAVDDIDEISTGDIETNKTEEQNSPGETAIADESPPQSTSISTQPPSPSDLPPESTPEISRVDKFLPSYTDIKNWWDSVLERIRELLPQEWQEKLSDWVLTGILALIIICLMLGAVILIPQRSSEIAEIPPETIETPPELKAPSRPKKVEVAPPPEPILTPEQNFIAAIQDELLGLTREYPQKLVEAIETNFFNSKLIVTVGQPWYELSSRKQDKFANAILKRSQKLDFRKLEIVNQQGNLIARSPVVGNSMVIFQRTVQ